MNTKVWHHRILISQYQNLKGQLGPCVGYITLFPSAAKTTVGKFQVTTPKSYQTNKQDNVIEEEENGDDDVTGRDLSCELLKAGSSQAGCTTTALIRSSRNSLSLKSQDLVLVFGLCPRSMIDMIKV